MLGTRLLNKVRGEAVEYGDEPYIQMISAYARQSELV